MENEETTLGIAPNIEGLLCYLLGWITGIIFLVVEKENYFVRFHALQSVLVFGGLFILSLIFGAIPVLGIIVNVIIFPISIILWLLLMYKAYQGEKYKLPKIGDFAEEKVEELKS